jgi:hypothetical protein
MPDRMACSSGSSSKLPWSLSFSNWLYMPMPDLPCTPGHTFKQDTFKQHTFKQQPKALVTMLYLFTVVAYYSDSNLRNSFGLLLCCNGRSLVSIHNHSGEKPYHEDEGIGSSHEGHELSIGVLVVQHLQLLLSCLGRSLPPHCIVPHLQARHVHQRLMRYRRDAGIGGYQHS